MKMRSARMILWLFVFCLVSTGTITSCGHEGGPEEPFSDGKDCMSCHEPNPYLGLGAGHSSFSVGESEPAIGIRVRVDMADMPAKSDKYGVMLLTTDRGNISEAGWTVVADPNGTAPPSSYIERPASDNSFLHWRVNNAPGNHTVKVVVMFGSDGDPYYKELDVPVPIPEPAENTPPQLTSPTALLLADGKTYDFEVTYSDINHDTPLNVTVNISGLGSFEMEEKPPGPYNATAGVTFYHLSVLPEGRYSYHFSAYDGYSWNSTSNRELRAFEEEEEIDITPLALGVFAGLIVISAVFVLRRR
ncbi:MAG: hypothetical protein JSW28_07760 [Thermoplasmata archaeon]|nr:MAG: hypothetical protein JSW28_07760 [Thermoplasmata archaeon]